jgi:MFS family permease
MTWNAIASMIAAFAGGRLVDRFGGRLVVIPGLIIFAIDTFLFSFLGPHTSFTIVAALLVLRGIGSGLTTQPLVAASLHDIQEAVELVHASTLTGVLRNLVGGAGVAVIASFVQSRAARPVEGGGTDGHRLLPTGALIAAIDASFLLCLALLILALIVVVAVLPKGGRKSSRLTAKFAAR